MARTSPNSSLPARRVAVIGAGMAGITCALTLAKAGRQVVVFEQGAEAGGRMSTRDTPFGSFDPGAQYFTVRDERFGQALQATAAPCRPWSANSVRVLDPHGRVAEAARPTGEAHFVATPGMGALLQHWAAPLAAGGQLIGNTRVMRIERDALHAERWQLRTEGMAGEQHVHSDFDAIVLAIPSAQARELLLVSGLAPGLSDAMESVQVAPCWTLMLAFPQAPAPGQLGPQWNAARSTHHRVAWLARESSKPRRGSVERWTVQASAEWSAEHAGDDAPRIQAKLLRAFSEITGIHAEPSYAEAICWRHARTLVPLGQPYLWDARARIGACGDWCLGHRVEDAFVSALELSLNMA
ncbi:NAD(P)/FAD-dependent oxidoreductase [Variovorax sp. VNK109]|uniref:NAD(P)/FAD-dependent oxidoreductase n=1 Tax=Variovorax sp. VNK109 TaxID=3400919 RepID=UPI003C0A28EC